MVAGCGEQSIHATQKCMVVVCCRRGFKGWGDLYETLQTTGLHARRDRWMRIWGKQGPNARLEPCFAKKDLVDPKSTSFRYYVFFQHLSVEDSPWTNSSCRLDRRIFITSPGVGPESCLPKRSCQNKLIGNYDLRYPYFFIFFLKVFFLFLGFNLKNSRN